MKRHAFPLFAGIAMAVVLAAAPAPPSTAAGTITLQAVRSWSSPTHTRVVFDFSHTVVPVTPDSGSSSEIVVTIPGEQIVRAKDVPHLLRVTDGVIDSVEVIALQNVTRLRLRFAGTKEFKTFSLAGGDDKPYRFVVDVTNPAGEQAMAQRIAGIAAKKQAGRTMIVAVDAGHGGEDPGARGPGGLLEKKVVLSIAKATVKALDAIPGVKGVLTRNGDYFIPLRERYHLAERMKADVFISIHANSSARRGRGQGTEVYFLSLGGASDQAVADLANLENAADKMGGIPPQAENDLVNILYDVKRTSALKQSELLAETILQNVSADRRLEMRGVKQAGFVVLKSVDFPSALVEVAFINNPTEARLLNSTTFQNETADKIATGVKEYFQRAGVKLSAAPGSASGVAGASP